MRPHPGAKRRRLWAPRVWRSWAFGRRRRSRPRAPATKRQVTLGRQLLLRCVANSDDAKTLAPSYGSLCTPGAHDRESGLPKANPVALLVALSTPRYQESPHLALALVLVGNVF